MVTRARIVVEYLHEEEQTPFVRWERNTIVDGNSNTQIGVDHWAAMDTCELLGRAFELILREEEKDVSRGLTAFFEGAVLQKEDVLLALEKAPQKTR